MNPSAAPGELLVDVADPPASLSTRYLPFEARHTRSAAVTRGIIGQSIGVAPGSYFVSVKLPDGEILETPSPVEVAAAGKSTAFVARASMPPELGAAPADAASPSAPSPLASLSGRVREMISDLDQKPPWVRTILLAGVSKLLQLFGKQLLSSLQEKVDLGWAQEAVSAQLRRMSRFESGQMLLDSLLTTSSPQARFVSITWDVRSSRSVPKPDQSPNLLNLAVGPIAVLAGNVEGRFIEVSGSKGDHLVVAMPNDGSGYTVATCAADGPASDAGGSGSSRTGELIVECYFSDRDTNALFQYMARGEFLEARGMAAAMFSSKAPETENAKPPTKLARLFASYVQLRENRLEGLQQVVDRLMDEWPGSPDVAAVRMELLARNGQHLAAAELCASMPALGVPMMASGIAYVQQRSRQYLENVAGAGDEGLLMDGDSFSLPPALARALEKAWKTIAPIGAGLDSRTIVTAIRLRSESRS